MLCRRLLPRRLTPSFHASEGSSFGRCAVARICVEALFVGSLRVGYLSIIRGETCITVVWSMAGYLSNPPIA